MSIIRSATVADHGALTALWERSVRSTHDFLTDAEILALRPLVAQQFQALQVHLYQDTQGRALGFVGVGEDKVHMLFLEPQARGQGIGRLLLEHAVLKLGARRLDVNEQNPGAVGFYRRMGWVQTGRSPVDGQGRPLALLHMQYRPASLQDRGQELIRVMPCTLQDVRAWRALRAQLWPGATPAMHARETQEALERPECQGQFIARSRADGSACGLIELSLRNAYENGCHSAPMAYMQGLYVAPALRRRGVARALVMAGQTWARRQGCSQFASDVAADNHASIALHLALGLLESERVVLFRKRLHQRGAGA